MVCHDCDEPNHPHKIEEEMPEKISEKIHFKIQWLALDGSWNDSHMAPFDSAAVAVRFLSMRPDGAPHERIVKVTTVEEVLS
jgi:hypothetical protein